MTINRKQQWLFCGLFLFALVWVRAASSEEAAPFDQPDLKFEDRLHKVFEKYNSQSVPDSKWQSLLGDRRAETYQIQTGDTLWDISKTFFGDPNYWPKLWSENGRIENPHQILPRKKLKFLAGTEYEAPRMLLVDANEADAPTAPVYVSVDDNDDSIIDQDEPRVIGGKPPIPPALHVSNPPLKKLPESFVLPPEYKLKKFDSTGLDAHPTNTVSKTEGLQILPSYFAKAPPAGVGQIDEVVLSEETAAPTEKVFLKLTEPTKVGKRFNVFKSTGALEGVPEEQGTVIEVEGEIEITSVVDRDQQIYQASVTKLANPIRRGAIVSERPLPMVSFDLKGPHSSVQAHIIGGEFDLDRKVLGPGGTVYIDKGNASGLKVGDILGIDQLRKTVREESAFPEMRTTVGLMKVAEVEDDSASGVIVSSETAIHPGDITSGDLPASHKTDDPPIQKVRDIEASGITER
jgi:hypothetical protein